MISKSYKNELENKIETLEKQIRDNAKNLDKFQNEQLFSQKVLDSLPGIFYLYNEKGTLIRWNKAHETISGYSSEELPEIGIYDWFSQSDKSRVRRAVEQILHKGEKRDVEANLLIKNGSLIPHYFTGVRMTIDGVKYLLGMGTDITQLKKTENLLIKSEEKYRNIVENAVEGIYQSSPEGRIISANDSMAKILGYQSAQDFINSTSNLAKDVYVSRNERKKFVKLMEKNSSVSGFEVKFYKRDKSIIWVSLHARPVFDSKGKLSLIEGMILDITKKRRQRESLEKSEALLREENLKLRQNIKDRYRFAEIVGKSPGMQEVYDLILKASATDANVIIYGESGTGKEIVAKAIHNLSDRKKGRFIPVNCGAIPENLIESEFFGYKKGAFTGATTDREGLFDLAQGGTLFLDELGEIPQNLQVKLLRVIEGGGYTPVGGKEIKTPNARIIAATNQNLKQYVAKGKMREDFFYRIHIIPINLPPLRDRIEDIPLLTEHFLKEMAGTDEIMVLSGEMMAALFNHSWPGNVRELQNVLQRYITLGNFNLIDEVDQEIKIFKRPQAIPVMKEGENYSKMMDAYEKKLIVSTLESCLWNREKAASLLEIPIRTFYRKMKKYCLKRQDMSNLA
ncbi:MAG: sigma-54-dependent Fis family transcriptional regulator [Desulfobacula sp.]|jgi:PAS domain S-box-containing protein|nr:sigma-54-dependent Fis family transcriptional regulator [Desulfobacula sp.]